MSSISHEKNPESNTSKQCACHVCGKTVHVLKAGTLRKHSNSKAPKDGGLWAPLCKGIGQQAQFPDNTRCNDTTHKDKR